MLEKLGIKNLRRPLIPDRNRNVATGGYGYGGRGALTRYWTTLRDWSRRDRHLDGQREGHALDLAEAYLSSAVMSCVGYIASMLPTCPWMLEEKVKGAWQPIDSHPVLDLLIKPTEWHTGTELLECLIIDRCIAGYSYAQRVSAMASGPPQELWFTPFAMVRPDWDASGLKGWEYQQDGRWMPHPAETFIQLRHRQDPSNPFLGVSPLWPLASEVWIDREATRLSRALLAKPFFGQVVTLEDSQYVDVNDDDIKATRDYMKEAYSGNNRGDLAFFPFPAKVTRGAFVPPDLMHPKPLHDFVEERVSAIYRIPAAVLQFGTGLEQTTQNATLVQYEKQAWESGIMPVATSIAQQLGNQLLPDFGLDVSRYRLAFDYSHVEALQPNRLEEAQVHNLRVQGGYETVAEAREAGGMEVAETDKVYLRGISVVEVPQGMSQLDLDKERAEALTPPQLQGLDGDGDGEDPPNDDGNGGDDPDDEMKRWGGKRLSAAQRQALLQRMTDDQTRLEAEFQAELLAVFNEMGETAAAAAGGVEWQNNPEN